MVLSMNSGNFQQNSPEQGLTWNFQDPENTRLAGAPQANEHFQSFDGLPRINTDQFYMTAASSIPLMLDDYSQMSSSQGSASWDTPVTSSQGDNGTGYSYNCSTTFSGNDQHQNAPLKPYANVPRTSWHAPYDPRMLNENMQMTLPTYEPTAALGQNSLQHLTSPGIDNSGRIDDCIMLDGVSRSINRTSPSSMCSEEDIHTSREHTATDAEPEDHGADEPYAKLIYRALMSAPDHSMVLQEIYRWFRENTTKGSSDTKGWMNSIRHNLSMNAAFKKTERKIVGEETKKSTEWVLEEFAIRDGVQSTTRYRKGTNNKKYTKPEAQSQSYLGRHSYNAIRKPSFFSSSKGKIQRQRGRDEPRRALPPSRFESTVYSSGPYNNSNMAAVSASPRRSPLTPNREDVEAYSPVIKEEDYNTVYDLYNFEDCQGVLHDDEAPLFMDDQTSAQYMQAQPMCASQQY